MKKLSVYQGSRDQVRALQGSCSKLLCTHNFKLFKHKLLGWKGGVGTELLGSKGGEATWGLPLDRQALAVAPRAPAGSTHLQLGRRPAQRVQLEHKAAVRVPAGGQGLGMAA